MLKKLSIQLVLIALLYFWGTVLQQGHKPHLRYLWSDAEGYFIYLPAVFVHGSFQGFACRDSVMIQHLAPDDKVFTKFTYGTALMELPFFLIAQTSRAIQGFSLHHDSYTTDYGVMVLVGACFYFVMGIFLIAKILHRHFQNPWVVWTAVAAVSIGSNALFYVVRQPGFSHIYSFFLMSVLLYYTPMFVKNIDRKSVFAMSLLYGLIVLIRPTNALVLFYLLLFDVQTPSNLSERKRFWLSHWRLSGVALLGVLLPMLPQLAYWQYIFGRPIAYSYENERFDWLHPKLGHLWFDVLNGMFPYTPMMFVVVFGLCWMAWRGVLNGRLVLGLFLSLSYVWSCWWCWWFGGAHGQRNIVEWMPFFAFPIAYLLDIAVRKSLLWQVLSFLSVFILIFWNMRFVHLHELGWFGDGWNWNAYWDYVRQAFYR
jgi:hypothetical protein